MLMIWTHNFLPKNAHITIWTCDSFQNMIMIWIHNFLPKNAHIKIWTHNFLPKIAHIRIRTHNFCQKMLTLVFVTFLSQNLEFLPWKTTNYIPPFFFINNTKIQKNTRLTCVFFFFFNFISNTLFFIWIQIKMKINDKKNAIVLNRTLLIKLL